jgi:hypothetical protein
VAAFDERAAGYDQGWLGRLHHEIADQTGYLLRLLASRCPGAAELAGVDPAPGMIKVAAASAAYERLRFSVIINAAAATA